MTMTNRALWGERAALAALLVLVALTFYPFVLMIFTSLKDNAQFYLSFWAPPVPAHWDNYPTAFLVIWPYLINTAVVAVAAVAGVLFVSALAAYAFARFSFPGRTILYGMIISLMMIPFILTLVPSFLLVRNLGILNTRWALILPYVAGGEVLTVFILRSFFANLPEELFEAARIDGASDLQIFLRIGLPLTRAALGTVAILQLIGVWNDYIWPSIVISDDSLRTLVVGLVFFQQRTGTDWGPLMAGYTIAALPLLVVFAFTTRYFIEGLTVGALKL
jgi:ABC-type glycerol-3-phosphate transport system permease component